ncbi:hypothetical protein KVT40_001512 [Elsinoe batatas]|uniref:DUF7924 domain-containing protein n=1 Tax=Elsinoe batatas TaxID=2601811 RepID=A0A8K0PJU3_9PEZI|nr:hypothetical protein KVT40_001512 [Elsinoe batatas]
MCMRCATGGFLESRSGCSETGIREKQLPSPSESSSKCRSSVPAKRRASLPDENEPAVKRRKQEEEDTFRPTDPLSNPILYWTDHHRWPSASLGNIPATMSKLASTTKRKSESPHRSDRLQLLAENGVFMKTSTKLSKSSKDMCGRLLRESRDICRYTAIPPDQLINLLERVAASNEARLRRDVMPWIVPSAELLYFCGELNHDYIGDAVDADWIRCATMGSTRPKPDYCAGLLTHAYNQAELAALRAYASAQRPVFFTPELSFPFLVCEVKTGETGLNQADRQNIHSASIAVRAIVELYKAAFGVQDPARITNLYGQVLAFSISHDNDRAQVYGHYCALKEATNDELEFYRYPLTFVSLSAADGADKDRVYSFTRNVYDRFVPEHLHRIKAAAACLPQPPMQTGLSFSTSELGLSEAGSQEADAVDEFRVPGTPASTIESEQMRRLMQQVEEQKRLTEQQQQQMEQQKRLTEQQQQQIEQQKRQLEGELERQKHQMQEQMEQQKQVIVSMNKELQRLRGDE